MARTLVILVLSSFFSSTVISFLTDVNGTTEFLDTIKMEVGEDNDMCIKSTGADPEEVHLLWSKLIFLQKRSLECYMECIYVHKKYINDDGEIVHENLVADVTNATYHAVEECSSKVRSMTDRCAKTYQFAICLMHTNNTDLISQL
ncbi:hypothetical protein RI129_011041 [Pyrocoelia pectoralis]|uniref:Uncharacterized protein n=1 Tax=Pyrocoelia pectoralis TaxID=417401 RepID=A0AAN7V081_9COLE